MHLNRDHSERVNVRFLAGILFTKDFRGGPSRSVDILACISTYGIQVRYDGDADIRNTCMRNIVNNLHKYVHLDGSFLPTTTTSFGA